MPYKDPEVQRAYDAKYRAEHPEKGRARVTKWRIEHPEEARARAYKYRAEHPEEERARAAKYHVAHREEGRAAAANYRHRKRANGGNFPRAAWEHLKALFGHCCAYCGRRMERLTQDHVIPISRGGYHFSGNIVPACQSCNSRKGARAALA